MYIRFTYKEHFAKGISYCYLKMSVFGLKDSVKWDESLHFPALQKTFYALSVNVFVLYSSLKFASELQLLHKIASIVCDNLN